MKTFKAIIVGFGNIGYYYSLDKKRKKTWSHFEAFQKIKRIELVGIVETSAKKRLFIKNNFPKLKTYKSIDVVLNDKINIDIYSICTPTETHYEILKKLINNNIKLIICEKPLCSNIKDAKKLYSLSKKKKSIIVINHQRRFEKNYLIARNIIKKKIIGNIKFINACYTRKIFNIGTHLIDIIRMLVSSELSFTSSFYVEKTLKKDPSLSGLIFFKNKIICAVQAIGYKFKYIFDIEIFGDKGKIRITNNGNKLDVFKFKKSKNFTNYSELEKIKLNKKLFSEKKLNDPIKDLIHNSLNAYTKRSKPNPSIYDGYQNLLIAKTMEKSAKQKKIIKV